MQKSSVHNWTVKNQMHNEMKHATQPQNAIKIDAKNKSGQEKAKFNVNENSLHIHVIMLHFTISMQQITY